MSSASLRRAILLGAFFILGLTTQRVLADPISQNNACSGYWVMQEFGLQNPFIITEGEGTYRGTFTASSNTNPLIAEISTDGAGYFSFDFKAPLGGALEPGEYINCKRYPFQSSLECGLDISGHGRGCNELNGSFKVHEIERDGSGVLTKFAADYIQFCEGKSPPLRGQIRFKSDYPLTLLSCKDDSVPVGGGDDGDNGNGEGGDDGSGEDGSCETVTILTTSDDEYTYSLCDGVITDEDGEEVGSEVQAGERGSLTKKGVKYSVKVSNNGELATISAVKTKNDEKYTAKLKKKHGERVYVIRKSANSGVYYSDDEGLVYSVKANLKKVGEDEYKLKFKSLEVGEISSEDNSGDPEE